MVCNILIYLRPSGEFVAYKQAKFLVCGFKTIFQTGSGFNTVNSKETNEKFKFK